MSNFEQMMNRLMNDKSVEVLMALALTLMSGACATTEHTGVKGQIYQKISEQKDQFRNCYETQLKINSKLGKGIIKTDFKIEVTGLVSNVEIVKDDIQNKPLNECVLKTLKSILFDKKSVPTEVTFPFKFDRN